MSCVFCRLAERVNVVLCDSKSHFSQDCQCSSVCVRADVPLLGQWTSVAAKLDIHVVKLSEINVFNAKSG